MQSSDTEACGQRRHWDQEINVWLYFNTYNELAYCLQTDILL